MTNKKLEKKYIILIVLVCVAIFLGVVTKIVNEDRKLNPLEQGVKDIVISINKVINVPINYVKNKITEANEKEDLYNKYKKLQEQVDSYYNNVAKINELEKENKELKKLLEIDYTLSDYTYLNALVVNRNIGYWYNTITIDKGRNSGITENIPVVNGDGLVGKIIKTTNFSSTIKLLTSEELNSKISIKIKVDDKHIYGLLTGYKKDKNRFIIEGISEDIEIPVDALVTTTGMGDVFPSGIIIGKVKSVGTDNFDLAKIVEVESSVDFNDISFVTVLKRKAIKE
ncbi:MAG: rod shape-determining protein MreC [Bacilli bacterium]|nr:rod shape-determining protein MreC [Bacilli bacterium]MDD4608076.1 rod shape-determining protein MreC [Bacilli bacterium]